MIIVVVVIILRNSISLSFLICEMGGGKVYPSHSDFIIGNSLKVQYANTADKISHPSKLTEAGHSWKRMQYDETGLPEATPPHCLPTATRHSGALGKRKLAFF